MHNRVFLDFTKDKKGVLRNISSLHDRDRVEGIREGIPKFCLPKERGSKTVVAPRGEWGTCSPKSKKLAKIVKEEWYIQN